MKTKLKQAIETHNCAGDLRYGYKNHINIAGKIIIFIPYIILYFWCFIMDCLCIFIEMLCK